MIEDILYIIRFRKFNFPSRSELDVEKWHSFYFQPGSQNVLFLCISQIAS